MKIIRCIRKIMGMDKSNVLVVDDIESNVELLSSYLNQIKEVKTYKSCSSKESEVILSDVDFSLIILDIQMPIMDGYELAMKIKSGVYGKNKNTPIMFITGIYDNDIDKMRGYNIGSIDYILKPIDYDEFISKVKKYIRVDETKFTDIRMKNIKKSIDI